MKKAHQRWAFINYFRLSLRAVFTAIPSGLVVLLYQKIIMTSNPPVDPPVESIKKALSAARVSTYEIATTAAPTLEGALALYAWNSQVSAAMLSPLHMCEVVIRNAVSDALTGEYGDRWPWNPAFEKSLPTSGKFNMRAHLTTKRKGKPTTGKVIPELAFVFWEKMFTGRFDGNVWNRHLANVMPHLDPSWNTQTARGKVNKDINQIRALRNRIAHHEPIIKRSLSDDFQLIQELIGFRCPVTAAWMVQHQQAQPFFGTKPA